VKINRSGTGTKDILDAAQALYLKTEKKKFKFLKCWEYLNTRPKFSSFLANKQRSHKCLPNFPKDTTNLPDQFCVLEFKEEDLGDKFPRTCVSGLCAPCARKNNTEHAGSQGRSVYSCGREFDIAFKLTVSNLSICRQDSLILIVLLMSMQCLTLRTTSLYGISRMRFIGSFVESFFETPYELVESRLCWVLFGYFCRMKLVWNELLQFWKCRMTGWFDVLLGGVVTGTA
jgi:hypothetical protein